MTDNRAFGEAILRQAAEHESEVLRALRGTGASTTSVVAYSVGFRYGNNRMHGQYVRRLLLDLEMRGLVTRLDDEKPVCWMPVKDSV
ncbi:hypothetical protein [Cupriavidus sp.]|uniref:hypothetical protein n=1 Tax=Cupriavidus sp. TaxID=1873897 RepID=UPI0025B846AF|nr:hypothetical protein [Cupriavidus sp.]MCA3183936.1 hypothetical protein [Cupriavidus sp.]MCA3193578.1 hypothetical protein [Cupriavidus sp.]MCA3199968.1 hypothetical protein [Cupriavidus sp.]MCA3201981.1 hypothetical protein [Cupriavidus sp.]MCA3233933.1 hypothetical protein [Cupriavidus sp.]